MLIRGKLLKTGHNYDILPFVMQCMLQHHSLPMITQFAFTFREWHVPICYMQLEATGKTTVGCCLGHKYM